MLVGHQGYVPEPYFLTETLRSQNRFHDPLQDSLFSNSGSVQGFREWSGRSSPQTGESANVTPVDPQGRTLLVRSSRPIGHATTLNPISNTPYLLNQPRCTMISENLYEAHLPTLVTPKSKIPGGNISKSIRYAILEVSSVEVPTMGLSVKYFISGTLCWTVAIWISKVCSKFDATFCRKSRQFFQDWIRIATEIELNYTFDAFVILHGTDTMAYTSSALSFLLEDLGKTVVSRTPSHGFKSLPLSHNYPFGDINWSSNPFVSTPK